ncbi:MAG: dihydrofolate reductase [bacterium]|nr:dihydrofolate reductase [bacterium]
MNNPIISAIAAIDENRGIAKNGKIPWRISDDMKHFKEITTGHVVIMGRKTYQTIGNPLPNRTNIIVTRNPEFNAPGCIVTHTVEAAIQKAQQIEPEEIFIIGGAEIYTEALPGTHKLYLTIIEDSFNCDTFFPQYEQFKTKISYEKKESNGTKYSYISLSK